MPPDPTTPPTEPPANPPPATPPTSPPPAAQETDDWKAKYEATLAESRKWEDRAKANAQAAKERDALKQSSMTEQEKAVAAARAEARTEALREVGSRVVDAEIKAAAAGRTVDVEALLEGLDRTRFLTAEGEPDTSAIVKWMDRVAPPGEPGKPTPKAPTGPRGNSTPPKPDMNALLRAAAGRG